MNLVRQIFLGRKASPQELHLLKAYLALELGLAAAQTGASDAFNAAVAELGMKVLSGEADDAVRRQMEEATARYSASMAGIKEDHAAIRAPEAAADHYAAQSLVYGDHLLWARAQQVLYQTLAAPSAVAELQDVDRRLKADKRHADSMKARLVSLMGISRHELNVMLGEASKSPDVRGEV